MRSRDRPVVSLEAGAGAENPPCPACGEPLFGWALAGRERAPVRRCERCGMAVVGGAAERSEAVAALEVAAAQGRPVANRRSLQAWLGSSGWAWIEPGSRFLFTPEAAARLGGSGGRPGFDFRGMWQTLANAFTFGRNLVLGATGRARATPAPRAWQRGLDVAIAAVTAVPLAAVAAVLEALAWVAGRGGRFVARLDGSGAGGT